jgi:hypothetical protein
LATPGNFSVEEFVGDFREINHRDILTRFGTGPIEASLLGMALKPHLPFPMPNTRLLISV